MQRDTPAAMSQSSTLSPPSELQPHLERPTLTVGDFAYTIIDEQFRYIVAQQEGVIADQDPEYVHQMRVGFRRFQAAATVFSPILLGNIDAKDAKIVLKRLGRLRDLDVQLQGIESKREHAKTPGLQKSLMQLRRDLMQQRRRAYQRVHKLLTHKSPYQSFKAQTQDWLTSPHYQTIAQLPVSSCVSELLLPIVSRLLLHPAWLLPASAMMQETTFHDLRKLCKQVRYQGEFFLPLYPKAFKRWIKDIKKLQSGLGELQDAHVFAEFMRKYQPGHPHDNMSYGWGDCVITQEWEALRQQYLDPTYRRQLHYLILSPTPESANPESPSPD